MKLSSGRAVLLLVALPWLCHAAAEVNDAETCDGKKSGAKAAAGSSMLQVRQQRIRTPFTPQKRPSIKRRIARLRRVKSNRRLALARRSLEHAAGVNANPCKSEGDLVSTNVIDDTTCGSYFNNCPDPECNMLNEENVNYSATSNESDFSIPPLGEWVQMMAQQCCRSFPASKQFPDRMITNPCKNPQDYDANHQLWGEMACGDVMTGNYEMYPPLDGYAAARKEGDCSKITGEFDWVEDCCSGATTLCTWSDDNDDWGPDDDHPWWDDNYTWDDEPSS